MRLGKVLAVLALTALAVTFAIPAAFAHPIAPSLIWSPGTINVGGTTTATYGVASDPDCTGNYYGTITISGPGAAGTFTVPSTPCGTTGTAVYPTAFGAGANTLTPGTYTATFSGNAQGPTTYCGSTGLCPFYVQDTFTVKAPSTVPEFSAPLIVVAASGLALLALVRKGGLLKL